MYLQRKTVTGGDGAFVTVCVNVMFCTHATEGSPKKNDPLSYV